MFSNLRYAIKKRVIKLLPLEQQARINGVKIGKNCFIKSRFWSTEGYLIRIGDDCQVTAGVKFFTHGGAQVAREFYPKFDCFGKISIGNRVYIGTNSLIMPGVTIGDNVLVAAGSVVCNSIPSSVVVGGCPARIICTVDEYIERNLPYNLDTKGLSSAAKKKILTNLPEEKFVKKRYLKFTK